MSGLLRRIEADEVGRSRQSDWIDAVTVEGARAIVDGVRRGGEGALRRYGERFAEVEPGGALVLGRDVLEDAAARVDGADRGVLERTRDRVASFAAAQRDALREIDVAVPGGRAGHAVVPVEAAGCYAPGGRYPLVSSAIMTVATARAAGCERVVLATPRPGELMLAAAGLCGADAVLPLGGAHAIAALAYGGGVIEGVDVIAGPGNAWVTAAKRCVAGDVGIDMLAGPSELLVLADSTADAGEVAADLLAQAEHDELARPMLVTTDAGLVEAVERELERQLETLATAPTARIALRNGFAAVAGDMDEAVAAVDRAAPEHLEIHARDAEGIGRRVRHAGAIFVGAGSAEVLGDYGLGPNHTLPTGGAARAGGGLSVLAFLRVRTWLRVDGVEAESLADVVRLAEIEGLEGHRRSAMVRGGRG